MGLTHVMFGSGRGSRTQHWMMQILVVPAGGGGGEVLNLVILGVAVTRQRNWRAEGPEDLGGTPQEGMELKVLLLHLTTLGHLPTIQGRRERGVGQGWDCPGRWAGRTGRASYRNDLQSLPIEGALGHGPVERGQRLRRGSPTAPPSADWPLECPSLSQDP